MKTTVLYLIFFISCLTVSAQVGYIDFDAVESEFRADTARVEGQVRQKLETAMMTMEMIEAAHLLDQGYDGLLNKYYKKLTNRLNSEGKELLKKTQREWMKMRDSEKELVRNMHLAVHEESGGGSIWGVVAAQASAEITRNRVFELYRYLMFDDIGGR